MKITPHEEDHHEDEIRTLGAHIISVGYAEHQIISCLGNDKKRIFSHCENVGRK